MSAGDVRRKYPLYNVRSKESKPLHLPHLNKHRPHLILHRRSRQTTLVEKRFDVNALSAFKTMPSFQPDNFKTTRPLMGACCACMPRSKRDLLSPELRSLGMRNILDMKTEMANSGLLSRCFPVEAFTLGRPLFRKYPDISLKVITSPRVLRAIEETSRQIAEDSGAEEESAKKLTQKECWRMVKKMKASVSSMFLKLTAWFLSRFLTQFLDGVQVCRGQMMMLKQASQKGIPMIYLPLHRSHLDYILVTLVLWNFDIRAPYVAAGDNLDIPLFSAFMRGLGGFFIRRRLDSQSGKRDVLYRAILHEYIATALRNGESLEFFIEGGRTRTGRAVIPKGGLLSVLVDALNEGEIPDAYIIPASFSYEKLIDGNFCREQMGQSKVGESFIGTLRAIFRALFSSYGSVRVDFAQPFSMKEFVDYIKRNPYPALSSPQTPGCSLERGNSFPNLQTINGQNGDGATNRMVVKALADHTVYTSDHCTAPMSTHLLAFLLLTKYRQGVYMRELTKAMHWIGRELQAVQIDVGFCGRSEDVIHHALSLMGKLVSKQWEEENNELRLCPDLSLPAVFELSYYANTVTTHFVLESIVACAIIHESDLSLFQLINGTSSLPETKVMREKVLETAEEICFILNSEFIFVPPCGNLQDSLAETLESFVSKEILCIESDLEDQTVFEGKDRRWAARLAMTLDMQEEDNLGSYNPNQVLQVNVDKYDSCERLHFLVSVLGPILESHLMVSKYALLELDRDTMETSFVKAVGDYARSQVQNGQALFSESCSTLNLKSAIKSLQALKLVDSYRTAGLTMLSINEQGDSRSILEHNTQLLQAVLV